MRARTFRPTSPAHIIAPATGDAPRSASLPAGLHVDDYTGSISGTQTSGDFSSKPIAVPTTDTHGQAISANFHSAVGDSGPTAIVIANQIAYEGKTFSLNVSNYFTAPAGDTLDLFGFGCRPASALTITPASSPARRPTATSATTPSRSRRLTPMARRSARPSIWLLVTVGRPPPPSQTRVPMRARLSRSTSPAILPPLLPATP